MNDNNYTYYYYTQYYILNLYFHFLAHLTNTKTP